MEVHHHPDLHHKKKKFPEYFLEFLMIFLAVTMGFIAENFREEMSEHRKEKEYVAGLITDLRQDTASLSMNISRNQKKLEGIDTLLSLAGKDISTPANRELFYHCCMYYMSSVNFFKNANVTLAQLKSTGGYRLIQKKDAANKIAAYDQTIPKIYTQEEMYNKGLLYAQEVLFELIDMTAYTNPAYFKGGVPTGKELPTILNDPQKLKEYFNRVFFARMLINSYNNHFLKDELKEATELIAFLQNTYHLENE